MVLAKEYELLIVIELGIIYTLCFYVIGDYLLVSMSAYGINEIAACPKCSTPQLFLYFRAPLKNLFCGNAFDQCNNFTCTIAWATLYHQMYVIFIRTNFQKMYFITLLNPFADIYKLCLNGFVENKFTVFSRQDNMIDQYSYVVALMPVLAHLCILAHAASSGVFTPRQ